MLVFTPEQLRLEGLGLMVYGSHILVCNLEKHPVGKPLTDPGCSFYC